MRTPRLLACALLLAASVPAFADPTLPTWTATEEPFGAWSQLHFADDAGVFHSVWCRWSECGNNVKTGQAKLYVMLRGSSFDFTYTDPQTKKSSQSSKTNYDTQLSGFTLDMATGKAYDPVSKKSFIVELEKSWIPTGYMVIVQPPKALAKDLPSDKPKTPVAVKPTQPGKKPTTPTGKKPVRRPAPRDENANDVYPKDEDMIGKVTDLKDWVAVTSKHGTFHCYLPGHPATGVGAWLKTAKRGGVCVEWKAPVPDAVGDDGGHKFKTRSLVTRGTLYNRAGKVWLHMGTSRVGNPTKIEAENATAFGATHVKLTPADAKEPAADVVALTDTETTWLSQSEKATYEAGKADMKAASAAARAAIKKNLRPDPGAVSAWETAVKGGKSAEIEAAIKAIKPWGGDVKEPVGNEGPNTEIQLTKEQHVALGKIDTEKAKAYETGRVGKNGGEEGGEFMKSVYFPVDLHNVTEEARRWLPDPNAPKPVSEKPLTQAEMDLLTPEELAAYKKSYLEPATKNGVVDENDENLKRESKRLRELIASEGRTPYKAPTSLAEFDVLQPWQKKKFCVDFPPSVGAVSGDKRGNEIDNRTDAKEGLKKTAGPKVSKEPKTVEAPGWGKKEMQAACDKFRKVPDTVDPGAGNGNGNISANVPPPHGEDKGASDGKKKDPWYQTQIFKEAVKGSLLGALIGSFGGPVGALIGAAVGGAIFAGINKLWG